jgi:hypothetical protein
MKALNETENPRCKESSEDELVLTYCVCPIVLKLTVNPERQTRRVGIISEQSKCCSQIPEARKLCNLAQQAINLWISNVVITVSCGT